MDKRKLHHVWRYLRHVHPWYFLVLTLLFAGLTVVGLRQNNQRMIVLREAVFAADKKGGDIESALGELRYYVSRHMNTNLSAGANAVHPPIQLKYTYERIQAARQQALGQNNSSLYGQAQETCNQQGQTGSAQETISCIQNFMAARGVQLEDVPDALYKFDFMSAKWSPDLAGWSIILAVLSAAAFVSSAIYHWFMKRYL
jgi:hypothetical protein